MKIKKFAVLIITNLLLLLFVFIVCEGIYFQRIKKLFYLEELPYHFNNKDILNAFGNYPSDRFHEYDNNFVSDKDPILFLGCSYTYGQGLDEKDSFPEQVKKMTNRWVYNFGKIGTGPPHAYILLKEEEKEPLIKDHKPKIIIYTYMFHHIDRVLLRIYFDTFRKDNFVSQKYNILYNSYIYTFYKNQELERLTPNFEYQVDLLITTMSKIKDLCDKLYPGNKFVFLIYSDVNKDLNQGFYGDNPKLFEKNRKRIDDYFKTMYSEEFRKRIENLGITVISTEELTGRKMDREDDRIPASQDPNHPHPSSKAWSEIVPKLVEKLNL